MKLPAFLLLGLFFISNECLLAQNGTILGTGRVGVGFNNRYADGSNKSDWLGFSIDVNDTFEQSVIDLDNIMGGGFSTHRIGWSREMARDPADLNQWLDGVESLVDQGNEVMVVMWGANPNGSKIADPVGDAALWSGVIDQIQQRGLMSGVSGFEIQNEPDGTSAEWRDYVRQVWKKVGPHGNVGWQNLTQAQRDETANAWLNKPIVVQGTNFGQRFESTLVNGLDGLNNIVWSAHHYSKFAGIQSGRENWTVAQWRSFYKDKWANDHALLNGNLIVTEVGTNNSFDLTLTGSGPDGTTADNRRDAGFVRAIKQYYGDAEDTTMYWYTAYNPANIGIGSNFESSWNIRNLHASNFAFHGEFYPEIPDGLENVALGKSVLASSERAANPSSLAVDGDLYHVESRWLTDGSEDFPHWLEIDLGGTFEISQLRLYTGFNDYENAISEFYFQHQVDGQWQDIFSIEGNNNPALLINFDTTVASYVRLYSTAGLNPVVRLFEIEIYGREFQAVPEPNAAVLFSMVLVGMLRRQRRDESERAKPT